MHASIIYTYHSVAPPNWIGTRHASHKQIKTQNAVFH